MRAASDHLGSRRRVAAGSKDGCPPARDNYMARGYAVASIGYRLSGDAIFPAQIEDCKAAIRWLRAHAKEHNLDANRFAVWEARPAATLSRYWARAAM